MLNAFVCGAYSDDSEIVVIVDGCSTHLFVVLLVSYSDESEIVAIADGCCTHLFVLLIVANSDDSE